MLDSVFAECFGRWGGRFSLIVPCEGEEIRPAYLPWLEAFDADIIYSYVDLPELVVKWLRERLGAAFFLKHEVGHRAERDYHA